MHDHLLDGHQLDLSPLSPLSCGGGEWRERGEKEKLCWHHPLDANRPVVCLCWAVGLDGR